MAPDGLDLAEMRDNPKDEDGKSKHLLITTGPANTMSWPRLASLAGSQVVAGSIDSEYYKFDVAVLGKSEGMEIQQDT